MSLLLIALYKYPYLLTCNSFVTMTIYRLFEYLNLFAASASAMLEAHTEAPNVAQGGLQSFQGATEP